MPSICQRLAAIVLLATAGTAEAASPDSAAEAKREVRLAGASRIYVTLVPRVEADDPRWNGPTLRPSLNLALPSKRRNRLTFSISRHDVLTEGDHLQLRMASDAHILAQLLSGGQFSEVDDSWIAVLGLASRFRLSYTNGPLEFSLSARHKFGDGNVRARLRYIVRF